MLKVEAARPDATRRPREKARRSAGRWMVMTKEKGGAAETAPPRDGYSAATA